MLLVESCHQLAGFEPPFNWSLPLPPALANASQGDVNLLHYVPSSSWKWLTCADYNEHQKVRVLRLRSNQLFGALTLQNTRYSAALLAAFPDGDVFGALAAQLLQPRAALLAFATDYARQHFRGRYVVGLQWRTHDSPFPIVGAEALNGVAACLAVALHERNRSHARAHEVAVFVASNEVLPHALRHTFPRLHVLHYQSDRGNTNAAIDLALLDVLLLGLADDIITTPGSTFGLLAALLSRKPVLELACARGTLGFCQPFAPFGCQACRRRHIFDAQAHVPPHGAGDDGAAALREAPHGWRWPNDPSAREACPGGSPLAPAWLWVALVRSSLYDSNPGNTHVSTNSEHDAASDRRSSPSSAEACDASNISRPAYIDVRATGNWSRPRRGLYGLLDTLQYSARTNGEGFRRVGKQLATLLG